MSMGTYLLKVLLLLEWLLFLHPSAYCRNDHHLQISWPLGHSADSLKYKSTQPKCAGHFLSCRDPFSQQRRETQQTGSGEGAVDAQHPQLRRCWTLMIKIPMELDQRNWLLLPLLPWNLNSATFCTLACVCEITGWRPPGWFCTPKSYFPRTLTLLVQPWERWFPTPSLNLLWTWELEMAVGEVGNGWDISWRTFQSRKQRPSHQR